MDRQRIFNDAWNGMQSQGWKQSRGRAPSSLACRYRGRDDRKCAIGWLIPDDKYTPDIETRTVRHGWRMIGPILREIYGPTGPNDIEFLMELQSAHDQFDRAAKRKRQFECLAEQYDLKIPESQVENN